MNDRRALNSGRACNSPGSVAIDAVSLLWFQFSLINRGVRGGIDHNVGAKLRDSRFYRTRMQKIYIRSCAETECDILVKARRFTQRPCHLPLGPNYIQPHYCLTPSRGQDARRCILFDARAPTSRRDRDTSGRFFQFRSRTSPGRATPTRFRVWLRRSHSADRGPVDRSQTKSMSWYD